MGRKHVMLSYQWDSQELVVRVYNSLTLLGYGLWMDIMGGISGGNIFASMAQSVENSSAIVCFMTEGYERSPNGERELTYGQNKNVTIIPCLLQDRAESGDQYEPTGWLGLLTSNLLYVDFTKAESDDEAYANAIENLVKQLDFYKIIPDITAAEARSDTASSPRDFPTTIISDPLLSHFSQEPDQSCTGPLTSLRSSIESIPQHIVNRVRRQFTRSRSGSDSASSTSNSPVTRHSPASGSGLSADSEPSLEEQYLHLGKNPS